MDSFVCVRVCLFEAQCPALLSVMGPFGLVLGKHFEAGVGPSSWDLPALCAFGCAILRCSFCLQRFPLQLYLTNVHLFNLFDRVTFVCF